MYNHNKAQQSKNRVHISWDILYIFLKAPDVYVAFDVKLMYKQPCFVFRSHDHLPRIWQNQVTQPLEYDVLVESG